MKKKLFIAAICAAGLVSCDLEQIPENQVTFNNAFKSENELNATTSSILFFENAFLGKNDAFIAAGAKADNLSWNNELRDWNPRYAKDQDGQWTGLYNVIYESNLLLDNIGKTKGLSEERYNFHAGQANFAMGLSYFFLAQRYGDCVITKNSTDIVMYGRSPMIDVLNKAISSAETAFSILPTYDKLRGLNNTSITSRQYASKGNSAALLAQIYAWKGSVEELYGLQGNPKEDYQKAIDYATLLIEGKVGNYSLCSSPEELCSKLSHPEETNPEAIFTLTFDKARSEDSQTPNDVATAYLSWPVKETAQMGNIPYDNYLQLYPSTVDEMYPDPSDQRKQAFFYDIDNPVEVDGIQYAIPYKFRECIYTQNEFSETGKDFRSLNADYVYWRLADIILLRAECYNKLGQTDLAIADLNTIRNRAGAAAYPSIYDDGDLKKAIFKEREKELFGENDERYYDIIRNNYILEELHGKFQTLTASDIQNGALFLPIPSNAYSDRDGKVTNTMIRQTIYWMRYM